MLEQVVVMALSLLIVKSTRMTCRLNSVAVGEVEVVEDDDVVAEGVVAQVSEDKINKGILHAVRLMR
jgi:hypothetical protein